MTLHQRKLKPFDSEISCLKNPEKLLWEDYGVIKAEEAQFDENLRPLKVTFQDTQYLKEKDSIII